MDIITIVILTPRSENLDTTGNICKF